MAQKLKLPSISHSVVEDENSWNLRKSRAYKIRPVHMKGKKDSIPFCLMKRTHYVITPNRIKWVLSHLTHAEFEEIDDGVKGYHHCVIVLLFSA